MKEYEIGKDFEIKQTSKGRRNKSNNNFLLAKYINVGYYLMAPLLLGVFLGIAADYFFKTKPFFVGLFVFLGTISIFYNLFKLTKNE